VDWPAHTATSSKDRWMGAYSIGLFLGKCSFYCWHFPRWRWYCKLCGCKYNNKILLNYYKFAQWSSKIPGIIVVIILNISLRYSQPMKPRPVQKFSLLWVFLQRHSANVNVTQASDWWAFYCHTTNCYWQKNCVLCNMIDWVYTTSVTVNRVTRRFGFGRLDVLDKIAHF
jgi:hypothetical protein